MVDISRIDHLNMGVRSLEETAAFYREVFGFEEKQTGVALTGNPFAIIGLEDRVYLCLYEEGDLPLAGQDLRIHHFGFHVDDIDRALSEMRERGVRIQYEVHDPSTKEVLEGYVNQVEEWLEQNREDLQYESIYSWYSENRGSMTMISAPTK